MRHSTSLSKMEIFAKVVETGSLSQAARELSLTPSAVSKSLSQLEEFLGTALIKRTTRAIAATESGNRIYQRIKSILQDVEETINTAKQFNEPIGTLKITTPIAFSYYQLAKLLREFNERHPGIDTIVTLDDKCVNLSEDSVDVALRITDNKDWDYPAKLLSKIEWVYCASPDYLAQRPVIETPSSLTDHCCLVYPAMINKGNWAFTRDEQSQNVAIKGRISSNSSISLISMALNDIGIICAPRYAVQHYIDRKKLVIILPDYRPSTSHELYAMYFKTKMHNPLVRAFINFLDEKFSAGAPWDVAS